MSNSSNTPKTSTPKAITSKTDTPKTALSEFSLIERYFKQSSTRHTHTVLGIGDDCAVSDLPSGSELVSCMDTLIIGRHFLPDTSPHAIAYKSVAVNLSDLSAMGATPYAILLGLSLPSADECWLSQFGRGIHDICREFNIELIGGDTTKSELLTISITALGTVPKGRAITRSGAKIGDTIYLGGDVGLASVALGQCRQGIDCDKSAMNYPKPQVALGQALRGIAHSMIDVSDGLAQDLGHILSQSGVGAKLYLDTLPKHPTLTPLSQQQRWQHQLNGGDDYALVFTAPKTAVLPISDTPIIAIGEIVATQGLQLFYQNSPIDLPTQGWQHF